MAIAGENYAPVSMRWGNKERPTTRTSSIWKMWRDLESEPGRQQISVVLTGNLESPSSSFLESEDTSMDANEVENHYPQNHNQTGHQNQQEDENSSCLQPSPLGVPEKERVRKIFHEWGSKSFGGQGHKPCGSRMNNSSRARLLGENECKRVRIVREWIESSTQQGDTCTRLEEGTTETGSQIERVRDGLVDCGVGARRSYRRLYGRQAILDLYTKFKRERDRELDGLLENRFVSNFAHRHRIQALLRGRFLLNQRFAQHEKQTSVAASELGLLRQTHAVSDIRKGFLSKLNNHDHDHSREGAPCDTLSHNDMKYNHIEQAEEIFQEIPDEIGEEFETTNLTSNWEPHNPQEFSSPLRENHDKVTQNEEREQLPLTIELTDSVESNQEVDEVMVDHYRSNVEELEVEAWQESVTEDDEGGWHRLNENEDGWYQETAGSDYQESHEEWYENVLEDATESWVGGNSYQEAAPVARSDAFYASDDDSGSSRFELRELLSRRRVSNLLQSDFGSRLEQLMQSYLNRQDQAFESETENEWMPDREHQDPEQQSLDENSEGIEAVQRTEGDLHERGMINDLRIDMNMLQQRMNDMQRMLQACMDMQLQLQRSVQQEVYSALNRSSHSDAQEDGMQSYVSESSSGKGVCFLCCDDRFNTLPERCAHMYICPKCGEKVNWSKLKGSVMHP